MLCQENASIFGELRRLEPELGEQGRVEAHHAGPTATYAPFELLFCLFLKPQLASHLVFEVFLKEKRSRLRNGDHL